MLQRLLLIAVTCFAVVSTQAQEKKKSGSMINTGAAKGYGLAGCGLGSVLFGPKSGGIQIIAATTNGSTWNQMFGITFGSLNCEIPEAGMQAAVYIENNREVIAREAARGEGETLVGLANIMKCSNQEAFNKGVQSNFEKIFVESSNAYSNIKSLYNVISNDQALKTTCNTAV